MTRDKKEFIEAILSWFNTPKVGNDKVLDRQFLADAYDNITQPHWISVEDELPEEYIQVLCHGYNRRCKLDKGYIFTTCRVYNRDGYKCDGNGFEITDVPSAFSRVTHWMPLPQPPVVSKTENTGKKSNFDENCEKYRTVFDGWEDLTFEEKRDRINKFRSGQW